MGFTHDKIEARAYGLYLERKGNSGSQLSDWLKAEKEVEEGNAKRGRPSVKGAIRKKHFLREL